MAEFKLVISTKDGKSEQKEVKDAEALVFLGKKIGDKVAGDSFGMPGAELQITGGSDSTGFPMRFDVEGSARKKILALSGVGLKAKRKGQRQRKTVAGNTIYDKTAQINLKVLKAGKAVKEAEPAEDKPEAAEKAAPEAKEEEKKPEAEKAEVKEAAKTEEKAKEEESKPKTEEAEKQSEPKEEAKESPVKEEAPVEESEKKE